MKIRIAVVLGVFAWAGFLGAQEYRAPSPQELASGLRTLAKTSVLDSGVVVDRVSVSPDGRWLVYAYHGEDIRSNFIRLVSTNDGSRREVRVPWGFKHTPLIRSPDLLYFTLESSDPRYQDGIYFGPWGGPTDRWTLFEAGDFRDLAVSDDGRFLAASTGSFDRSPPRSTIKVWSLGSAGEKVGLGYAVAVGVTGQVRQIAWAPQGRSLVVEINIEKSGREWGQSNLYTAENRPGSAAQLLRNEGQNPVFVVKHGFPLLVFSEGDWQKSRVLTLRPGDRREEVVATLQNVDDFGLTANGMAWDPVGRRLVLGVQNSPETAGVVAFSLP